MHISKVIIENFMPYRGVQTVDLSQAEVISILGQSEGDFERSNRVGKSSFVDAVLWCLYGKSRAKKETELIHQGTEMMSVQVQIETDGGNFSVLRTRNAANKGSLELVGMEGEKRAFTQAQIVKTIGLDYDDFIATAFFRQNDIDQFMQSDSQSKKMMLLRWIRTADWPVYEERAKEFRDKIFKERTDVEVRLESMKVEVEPEQVLRKRMMDARDEIKKCELSVGAVADQKLNLRMQLKDLDKVESKQAEAIDIDREIEQVKRFRPDSAALGLKIKAVEEQLAKYPLITKARLDETDQKKEKIISEIAKINSEIARYEKELSVFEKERVGVCPILKERCDLVAPNPDRMEELKLWVEGRKKKIERYQDGKRRAENVSKLYFMQQNWTRERNEIFAKAQDATRLEEQIAALKTRKLKIMNEIPKNVDEQREKLRLWAEELESTENDLKVKISGHQRVYATASEQLKLVLNMAEKREALQKRYAGLTEQMEDASYLVFMFGKNGIPSIELENSFEEVEDDCNLILERLKAPFSMEFQAMRELAEWEPACLVCGQEYERKKGTAETCCPSCGIARERKKRDELSLRIFDGQNERPFYMDSGGGKVLLSVAIRIALMQLARKKAGTAWGTLFMDEVFGQLDGSNRRLLSELVTRTLLRDLGFEQIFVISHDSNISAAVSTRLVVNRTAQGFSELMLN